MRCFLAIELPEQVRFRLVSLQQQLGVLRQAVRWTQPEHIHLTVKFLGEVEEAMLAPIGEALRSVRSYPFPMALNGVAGNPPRTPRVIWCNVQDAGQSARLHGRVEEVLEPLGIPREPRAFTPHVTVARVKRFDPSLLLQIRAVAQATFGTCTVNGFSFKKSTLTPGGPVYENIMEVRW